MNRKQKERVTMIIGVRWQVTFIVGTHRKFEFEKDFWWSIVEIEMYEGLYWADRSFP